MSSRFYLFILSSLSICNGLAPGCTLYTDIDLPKKSDPIYLKERNGRLTFVIPELDENKKGYITLSAGEEIILACPGKGNSLIQTKEVINKAKCFRDNELEVNRKKYLSKDLTCESRVIATIQHKNSKCWLQGSGTTLNIGFQLPGYGFMKLIEVCHNIAEGETIYAKHTIHGQNVEGKIKANGRNFIVGDDSLYPGVNVDDVYTTKKQEVIFEQLLGRKQWKTILNGKTLAKGHLAPFADFFYASWQLNTNFYINSAPQWQSINSGVWRSIEHYVRTEAESLSSDLIVYTGTSGTLSLPDDNGKSVRMHLGHGTKLPVPKYLWKIVRYPKDNTCMGFISVNVPDVQFKKGTICNNVCNENGWQIKDPLGYCCLYEDMSSRINEIPKINCQKGVPLKYRRKRPRPAGW